jgi:4-aminobutyrate aminotransferase/(S)-3-amino-2-methylpropionate transaminase
MSQPEQRHLAPKIPGPKSQKLQVQRAAELPAVSSRCLSSSTSRWRHPGRCRRQSHHRLRVWDRCHSVGASDRAVVRRIAEQAERFTHTCFLVTGTRGRSRAASGRAQPADGTT